MSAFAPPARTRDILDLVVATLGAIDPAAQPPAYPTDAADRVFRPGDWPSQDGQYPLIKARVVRDFKQSLARSGPPEFTVTTTVRLEGQVSAPAAVDDAGARAAEDALWRLAGQIEVAVIGSYPLAAVIQQVATVDSQLAYTSDGETHLAGVQIDLAIEWFQGAEDFAPVAAIPLQQLGATVTNHPPVSLELDFPQ